MRKYLSMFSSYLKQAMAYRSDALAGALLSLVTVLMSYLLWNMLIPQGGTLDGFTLPEMVTYSVLCSALSPFAMNHDPIFAFADEIRSGKFSRFLYTPVNPFGAFVCSSLAASLPKCAFTLAASFLWGALLSGVMAPVSWGLLLQALPVLVLALVFVLLLNYLIACLAFRFTDILGVILIRSTLIQFFAGVLAPVELLFGGVPVWSPLTYLVGTPALLVMGRSSVSAGTACAVLILWSLPLLMLCLTVARSSRKFYEGVGA